MSLTTRCPSCGTTFKVVPDQLRISEGWVRCGHCADVFDASSNLQPLEAVLSAEGLQSAPVDGPAAREAAAPADTEGAAAVAPAVWQRRSMAARTVLHGDAPDDPLPAQVDAQVPPPPADLPGVAALSDPLHAEHGAAQTAGHDASGPPVGDSDDLPALPTLTDDVPSALLLQTADSDEPQDLLYQPAFAVPTAAPAGTAEARIEEAEDAVAAEAGSFGFVRAAERRAFWRRPLVVAASLAACLLLAAALLLQVAVHERDRLAASLPGLRPSLEAVCGRLQCSVSALKNIDAMVIEGSGFNKARGDLYQLSVDLRSNAGVPLAMPSVELTLTDAEDKTVLRRVLGPAELHAPLVLAARGAWSGALPVRLKDAADAARVAGYRVLAFYP